jgi:membrane fusion protein, multidrug efflux system
VTTSGPLILRYERPGEHHDRGSGWLRKLALVAMLGALGYGGYRFWLSRLPRVLVSPPEVSRGASGIGKVSARATLTATTVLVYPRVTGRVADMLFNAGTSVRAAQIIAHLENQALGRAAQRADSALDAARRAVTDAQLLQASDAERREAMRVALRRLQQASADGLAARRRLEETYITSPIDGRVVRRLAALGDRVAPARQPGARPVAEVMDVNTLRAVAEVPAAEARDIREGAAVRVRLDSVPNRWYRGMVNQVTPAGRVVRVSANLNGGDVRSRPGLAGSMEITTVSAGERVASRISVPAAAVRRDLGQTVVWIVNGGRVERRGVDAADEEDGMREIRQGLTGGELVIVSGPAELVPGQRVRAANAPVRTSSSP